MDSSCRLNGEGEGLKLKFDFLASDLRGACPNMRKCFSAATDLS